MRLLRILAGFGLASAFSASGAEWQWSVPMGSGRAFLWIPADCRRVRAVVVAQNNLLEKRILEHPVFRRTLTDVGVAEVWIVPPFDPVFDFTRGAGERFEALARALAEDSGYGELASAPVVPLGHSALASFPWNFAAWRPERTLAILSVKGDAPQTPLTGSGLPNPAWGSRGIDGVPALMVMGEYEWWEARLAPALEFRTAHPGAPLAFLADVGHGHFSASDALIGFLADFVRKAAAARLPAEPSAVEALRPVDPRQGWLVDRWRGEQSPRAPAAPFAAYSGDRSQAFWCFDGEMARRTEAAYAAERGRREQQVDFIEDGTFAPIASSHTGVTLRLEPERDGLTFRLMGGFIHPLARSRPIAAKDTPPAPIVVAPTPAAPDEHAAVAVRLCCVDGPALQLDARTFRVALDRTMATDDWRRGDIWLLASALGDSRFRHAEQQALLDLRLGGPWAGSAPGIDFPPLSDEPRGVREVRLRARSSVGGPVSYFVREGPAEVRGDRLLLTAVPVRARFPLRVTVVAWQLGRAADSGLRPFASTARTFSLLP